MDHKKLGIDEPILITGAARSGTSMTAGVINLCGAWGGEMVGSTRYNKRGMFENGQIRQDMIKPFLVSIDCDPLGQKPLPDINVVRRLALMNHYMWRTQVMRIIENQGHQDNRSWMYKGAKMCLIWPMWFFAFQRARWIIVRRDKDDIINSCLKTGFMSRYDCEQGWGNWVDSHIERFVEMAGAGLDVKEVWPQKMINGDFTEIREVVESLGLTWQKEKVVDFISPALWSAGIKKEEVTDGCSSHRHRS